MYDVLPSAGKPLIYYNTSLAGRQTGGASNDKDLSDVVTQKKKEEARQGKQGRLLCGARETNTKPTSQFLRFTISSTMTLRPYWLVPKNHSLLFVTDTSETY